MAHLYKARREAGATAARRAASSTFQNDLAQADASFEMANKGFLDRMAMLDFSGHDATAFVPAQLGKVGVGH